MYRSDKDPQCPECLLFDMRRWNPIRPQHRPACSQVTVHDLKFWLEYQGNINSSITKQRNLQMEAAARWEGKYRIVKHENNELRKKLYGAAKGK